MPRLLLIPLLFIVLIRPLETRAEEFTVGLDSTGVPPMEFPADHAETGIHRDILLAIGDITGDRFKFEHYPRIRILKMFNDGEIDIEAGINPAWRGSEATPGLFTLPFAKSVDILLFSPGARSEIQSPSELAGGTVGAVRGYVYTRMTPYFTSGEILRMDGESELQLLKLLEGGRLKQIIVNRAVAQYWMLRTPEYRGFRIGPVIEDLPIMMRLHPTRRSALTRIDNAIETLIESGGIEAIYERYRYTEE